MPEEVKDPVDDQQGDLVVEGDAVLDGVVCRHRRADDHVAEEEQAPGRRPRSIPGPVPPSSGERRSDPPRPRWGTTARRWGPACRGTARSARRWSPRRRRAATPRCHGRPLGLEHRSGQRRPSLHGDGWSACSSAAKMSRLTAGDFRRLASPRARRRRRCRPRCGGGRRRAGRGGRRRGRGTPGAPPPGRPGPTGRRGRRSG